MKYLSLAIFAVTLLLSPAATQAQQYGEEFQLVEVQPVEVILSSPEDYLNQPLVIEGELTQVCQKAGCWARVGQNATSENALFVKFGDHAFTIPLDSKGPVTIHGTLQKKERSVEQLRHLAKDQMKSRKEIRAIKEPKVEYWFMADGLQTN